MSTSDPVGAHQLGGPDTADLIDAIARGDQDAFRDFYRRSSGVVYGVALRVTRDSMLAQDVLQETYLQVWQEAGRYSAGRGSVRAWLLTIAHRRAVDRVRKEQSDGTRVETWSRRAIERDYDPVAEIVELRAEHRRVRVAFAELSPLQREALDLAYSKGLTQSQIAEVLAIPLGTAKTRLRDGVQRLRELLEVPNE